MKDNRRPFDMERYLAGDAVETRDGRKVTELHHFKTVNRERYCIAYVAYGEYYYTRIDGTRSEEPSNVDLLMSPKKVKGWVNVYKGKTGTGILFAVTNAFPSKEDADFSAKIGFAPTESEGPRLACIEIEVQV